MIGEPVPMIDAESRVRGTIEYVLTMDVPGMVHAVAARSDRPHARIAGIDTSAARAVDGVIDVLTGQDLKAADGITPCYGPVIPDQPIVAIDKVRYVGEPVAAVVAADEAAARRAADLIEVEYDDLPAVLSLEEAIAGGAAEIHPGASRPEPSATFVTVIPVRDLGGNINNRFELSQGDVAVGFAQADRVVEEVFHSPAVAHVPMEPHVAIAQVRAGRLDVWSSTQTPYAVQYELAQIFGLPTSKVRVRVPSLGGGFGAKVYAKIEPLVALLAWRTGRPVRMELSRAEDFLALTKHEVRITIRSGVTRDGLLVARDVRALFNSGAYSDISPRLITNAGAVTPGPYRIPNVHVESVAVFTNSPPAGAFRGFGVTQAAWACESHTDSVARTLGMDPVEFRLKNMLRDGDRYATGETLDGFRLADVLVDAADHVGWDRPPERPAAAHLRRGKGVASIMKATVTPTTSTAAVKLDRDGSVHLLTATVEMGQGSRTILAQLVAAALGISLDRVHIVDPDTDVTPFDQTTTSSRSTHSMGRAVQGALDDLLGRLKDVGGGLLGIAAEDVEVRDGRVQAKGDPAHGLSFAGLMTRSRAGSLLGTGSYITEGGLDPVTGQGVASVHWHQGAGAAEVEVDTETGKVRVLRYHSSVFAGRVINPRTAHLQVQGSAIFGLGQALFEEMVYDDGQLINANLSDYPIPALGDLPGALTASLLEDVSLDDVHGIGETSLPPVMPAVANAIAAALGVRPYDAPMTPERVLAALEESRHDR